MIYKGIVKQRDNKKKLFLSICCIILLYVEFMQRNWLYMAITVVVGLAIFFRKEHVVSEEGVEIRYYLLGMKISNKWKWEQITAIRPDFNKARPDILLEIAKDITIRPFVFKADDAWAVMELAKKMNAGIYVDDRTEETRKSDQQERDRRIAEARARQAQERKRAKEAKRKKKK